METTKTGSMTSGPLTGRILRFIIPLMLTGVLQLLYNAADSVIVGHWDGANALAAVSSVNALINLILNVFMGLSVGTSVAVAHDYGAEDYEGVRQTVHTSYLIALFGGILVGAIGMIFSRTFLIWMDSPADVLDLSTLYLTIFFIGTPANMVYTFGSAILRSVGDTKRPLYFLMISGLINVILNVIFIVVFHMGVAGVAAATVISQVISAVLVVIHQMRQTNCVRLELKQLRLHKEKLLKILKVGLPAGLQGTVFSISNVAIQSSVNSFGSAVMAANGAASSMEGFTYMAMNSVYQASLTFVGQNMGARKYERINRVVFTCLAIVTVIGLAFGLTTYIFAEPLLRIYIPDNPEAIPYGVTRLFYLAVPYFLCGWMEVMVGGQRGMGMSITPMITSLVGSCLLRIVWIETVFAATHSLVLLYMSYPISWIVTFGVHMIFYCIKLHQVKKKARLSGWVPAQK